MNYQDSLRLLTSQKKFYINLGLDRMKKVAEAFGNPQNSFKFIHVAGTNGKGSTCAMLAKILEENGYKTGLYTSPHITDYTERIKINFADISQYDFAKYVELVENVSRQEGIDLTEFEVLTMIAFLYFRDQKVDYAVIETGMGGRLDATNIVERPILTIITSISADHTDRLGKTVKEISFEKAGIIKKDVAVVVSSLNSGFNVIKNRADKLNAPLGTVISNYDLIDIDKNIFSDGKNRFRLSLLGINQGENLALVIKAAEILKLKVGNALEKIVWHSRFEYIKEKNLLIDAGHNPDGIKFLKQNLDVYFPNRKRVFLFGMLDTKDYKKAIKNLFREDDEVFVTDGFAHNAINKDVIIKEMAKQFPQMSVKTIDINDVKEFVDMDFDGIKICCGSFYLVSKIY